MNYPLLVYKQQEPIRHSINIVNLAVDTPQITLDIFPFKFICFVEQGMLDIAETCKEGESIIFFLVHDPTHQCYRLLAYRTIAWLTKESDLERIKNWK